MSWSYDDADEWHKTFPCGNGSRQSPINIDTSKTEFDQSLVDHPIDFDYVYCQGSQLSNTGHSFMVSVGKNCVIKGGPLLDHEYELLQFHAHWGGNAGCGSEHTIDHHAFPMELHFVHWNKTLYKDATEASGSPNGLAVIGIFANVGKENYQLKNITNELDQIREPDSSPVTIDVVDPIEIFPDSEGNKDYWTYSGSLTTPPLTENVTWIVVRQPIEVSEEQLNEIRQLEWHHGGNMVDNFRPVQELHDRVVRFAHI